jgi:hypothetical protein
LGSRDVVGRDGNPPIRISGPPGETPAFPLNRRAVLRRPLGGGTALWDGKLACGEDRASIAQEMLGTLDADQVAV